MISDFGTSEQMIRGKRERTGHTGTMEYMVSDRGNLPALITVGPRNADCERSRPMATQRFARRHVVSRYMFHDFILLIVPGLILHKLLFLHLPYAETADFAALQAEIISYPG
jgi:hypothetical protein